MGKMAAAVGQPGRSSIAPSHRRHATARALGWALAMWGLASALAVAAPSRGMAARDVPTTMLAAAIDRGGGPDVLGLRRLPVPKLKAGDVLIAVRSAGVAVWDAAERQHPGRGTHFPLVLGSDGAGTVVATGPGVRGLRVGDRVYGVASGRSGFYAQYVVTRAQDVSAIPRGIGLTEAGVLAVSGLSALQGIDDVLQLKPAQTLIIHGASGAVGTLAIQFAKLRGARVLATVTSAAGAALATRLGADAVVDGRTGDILAAAKRFAPNGVDAVLALAGGPGLERCIDALRSDGRGRVAYLFGVEPSPKPRFGLRMTVYSFVAGRREFERLDEAVEAAHLRVPIAAAYPLAEAAAAHRRLQAGHLLGKIALLVK